MPGVALTDHGSLSGAVQFYKAARDVGVKPIMGLELYVVNDRHGRAGVKERYTHLTMLARNNQGYSNLIKIGTAAYLEGYYYKPRADWELLERYNEGLICLTGCMSGRASVMLREGNDAAALAELERLIALFGRDNVYVELQDAGLAEQRELVPKLALLARQADLPTVATNDVHYLRHDDARAQDALVCIQTQCQLDEPRQAPRMSTEEFYLKTAEEMRELFAEYPEACDATLEIVERCDVTIEFGRLLLPRYPVPGGGAEDEELRRLCEEGLRRRYGPAADGPEVRERLEFELQTIREMGFSAYFLIVWDFVKFAKDAGIAVGPGRGSAAGSIVAYSLVDHRPRPAQVRPAVRALPQPRPQVDARHRHGLLGRAPRRGPRVRRAQVRARPRRPDHHLRHARRAGRHARRGPRARAALRDRRPHRQDDPRAGAAGDLQAGDGRRAASSSRPTTQTSRPGRWSTSRWPSRGSSATTPSTPPAWSSPTSRSPSTSRCSRRATPRWSPSSAWTTWRPWACSRWTSWACATST